VFSFLMFLLFSVGFFFFQAEDGIRDFHVTGVQTCALPIYKLVTKSSIDRHLFTRLNDIGLAKVEVLKNYLKTIDSTVTIDTYQRSEERRVGKECISRSSTDHLIEKEGCGLYEIGCTMVCY